MQYSYPTQPKWQLRSNGNGAQLTENCKIHNGRCKSRPENYTYRRKNGIILSRMPGTWWRRTSLWLELSRTGALHQCSMKCSELCSLSNCSLNFRSTDLLIDGRGPVSHGWRRKQCHSEMNWLLVSKVGFDMGYFWTITTLCIFTHRACWDGQTGKLSWTSGFVPGN